MKTKPKVLTKVDTYSSGDEDEEDENLTEEEKGKRFHFLEKLFLKATLIDFKEI